MSKKELFFNLNPVEFFKNLFVTKVILDRSPSPISFTSEPVTQLSELFKNNSDKYISFYNKHNQKTKVWLNFIDLMRNIILPPSIDKPCWWCRDVFNNSPIGCPLKYNFDFPCSQLPDNLKSEFKTNQITFFETEGIFCSFDCCKAYILENIHIHQNKYQKCLTMLNLMYIKLVESSSVNITPAPSWKIIDKWGGHLTINEFRSTFQKLFFKETINIKKPYMFPVGNFIEEFTKTT